MWTIRLTLLVVVVAASVMAAQQPSGVFVIDHVNIVDVNTGQVTRDGAIVIEGGRIREVGRRGNIRVPDQNILDARGKWAIPGLIDAHIHFSQSANIYTRPDVIDLRKWRPYETELAWIRERIPVTLRRYLASGVTGLVDMGGPMWTFDVRDQANQSPDAPRVAVAGPLLSTHLDGVRTPADPMKVLMTSPQQARELVRRNLERRPDLTKILWLREPGDNLGQQIEMIRAAMDESQTRGVRVAVHATDLEIATEAIRLGADILVHSVEDQRVDREFIDLARRGNILYIPTLMVLDGYREVLGLEVSLTDIEQRLGDPQVMATWGELDKLYDEEIPGGVPSVLPPGGPRVEFENLQLLDTARIRIVGATDAGNIGTLHGPAIHRELELLVEAGMRPVDALVSATKNAAAVMGREAEVGTLERGKQADIVLLDADPLADIKNTRKIFRVMKAGRFADINPASLR
jgi:imidazolonepropionase-like amidohydrolase